MSVSQLICITCPIGCHLEVEKVDDCTYLVTGNACKRGEKYGVEELTAPTRMVTTTVRIEGTHLPRIPVKTSKPIPKEKIFECMRLLNGVTVEAPVVCGDVVVENLFGLDIQVVASRSMGKQKEYEN
ncbi:MAG: DUF1667 domain-containing protein [Bacillus sp. (in: Bacteria)]|nr:DUF1667 domain-containing protein [Bacillus sp. (in: firmicutes)]